MMVKMSRCRMVKIIASASVIWAAGVKGNVPAGIDKEFMGETVSKVDRHCLVQGINNIYAIGDLAYMEEPKYPNGHPQVAAVAMQQADLLAENLIRIERKSTRFMNLSTTIKEQWQQWAAI